MNRIERPAIQGYALHARHSPLRRLLCGSVSLWYCRYPEARRQREEVQPQDMISTVSRLSAFASSSSFAETALIKSRTPSFVADEIAKNGFLSASARARRQ